MRNLHFWFAVGIGVLIAAFACSILRIAMAESLWLDELHTSWTVSGSWQEIASRAAAGNQTPLYFWLIGLLTQTLGHRPDWILRLPSAIAWIMAILLVAWQIRWKVAGKGSRGWLFALCIVAWIVLDELQWFFATEARPYAMLQLVSLAGWCCVQALFQNEARPNRTWMLIVAWCFLSVVNIYLHLTAVLPVFFQWLVGCWGVWRRYRQSRRSELAATPPQTPTNRFKEFGLAWTLAVVGVCLALLPILQLVFPVWHRRSQWATFASDVSMTKAAWMFPFVPVLSCVFIGCLVDRMWRSQENRPAVTFDVRCLWWTAMLGPWLLAWAITAIGVAPMFHPRYVFASALPLFVVGAIELLSCRHWATRWATSLAVAVAIVFSQGTASVWRAGYIVGNLRGEDWRAATRWVSQRLESGEPLLCSSGLIEANSSENYPLSLPLNDGFIEYLSFPLGGVYRITRSTGKTVPVTPLLGDHRQWAAQVIERLAEDPARPERLWLVYRGSPGRLKTKMAEFLADLRLNEIQLTASEPIPFGKLHVVQLTQAQ